MLGDGWVVLFGFFWVLGWGGGGRGRGGGGGGRIDKGQESGRKEVREQEKVGQSRVNIDKSQRRSPPDIQRSVSFTLHLQTLF